MLYLSLCEIPHSCIVSEVLGSLSFPAQMLLECFEADPGVDVVFQRLLDQVRDGHDVSVQAVVMLLDQFKNLKPDLEVEEKEQTGSDLKG